MRNLNRSHQSKSTTHRTDIVPVCSLRDTTTHQDSLYFIALLAVIDFVSGTCTVLPPMQHWLLDDIMRDERGLFASSPCSLVLIPLSDTVVMSQPANIALCLDRCTKSEHTVGRGNYADTLP